jgi:hypothetical protein
VAESLVAYGAPLAAYAPVASAPLEEALLEGLRLSHQDATLLRVLPVVVSRHSRTLDYSRLRARAREAGLEAELGMLLELTARLTGVDALRSEAEALTRPEGEPRYYFGETGRFARKLADERTPPFARRWGFLLNMSEESFRGVLAKHHA